MGKLLIPNFKKGGRMLSRNKDTDYLALSARIHAMEGRLLILNALLQIAPIN